MTEQRILVAGASGYIGRAVVRELVGRGYPVTALVRQLTADPELQRCLEGAELRTCDVCDRDGLHNLGIRQDRFQVIVSCIASRSGAPDDAQRVDRDANLTLIDAARAMDAHLVLLSAICVQQPLLAFQRAKLEAEQALVESGLRYSIVRPTAFFKSLAGQVQRVKRGKPFLVFGDGELTACKPISEQDLARFIADCITDPDKHNRVLPIGGPGPALTPLQQGALLFELCGRTPRYRRLPLALFDHASKILDTLGRVFPRLRDKAEFARTGRYYASESMLVWNDAAGRYEAEATPEFGSDTLRDYYRRLLESGMAGQELREHALFDRSGT